jgi:hypothetical protein
VHRLRSAPRALISVKARTLSPPFAQMQGAIDRLFKALAQLGASTRAPGKVMAKTAP